MKSHSLTGIEHTYQTHHTTGHRRGTTLFGGIRGEFLRSRIGTGKRILDIGCRDGELTREFYKGNEVLGVDIDREALLKLERELGIKTKHMDLHGEWDIPEGTFDVVVAGEVLEHLYYPERVCAKVCRVLVKDGVFLVSVPNAFSLANRVRLFFGKKSGTPLADPTHINHFSRKELAHLLKNNFKEVRITPLGKYAWLDRFFPGFFSFILLFEASSPKKT